MTERDGLGDPFGEERIGELLHAMREEVRAPADFRASVMRAVADVPSSPWRRMADWWLRPRPLRVSPAVGALALASAALLFMLRPGPDAGDVSSQPAQEPVRAATRFIVLAPAASSVHLTGDFVSWSPDGIVLEDQRGTGVWTVDVPLSPGVYQYTFVIDGEWVPDPRAVSQVDDGFGQVNSVVIVPDGGQA